MPSVQTYEYSAITTNFGMFAGVTCQWACIMLCTNLPNDISNLNAAQIEYEDNVQPFLHVLEKVLAGWNHPPAR